MSARETEATTSKSQPNVIVQTMTATYACFIRSLRVYAQTFMGLLSAQGLGAVDAILGSSVTPADFVGKLKVAAALSFAPAAFTFLQNAAELVMRLDEKLPKLRG